MRSHYAILGVPVKATQEDIKKAYRKLALVHHPDKGGDADSFKEICESYEILSDPVKRSSYDSPGVNFSPSMFQSPSADFFSNLFGRPAPDTSPPSKKTPNIPHKVVLTLEDFYAGKTCKFAISRKVECKDCKGEGGSGKRYVSCVGCSGSGIRVTQRKSNSICRSTCMQCRGTARKTVYDKMCPKCKTTGLVPERVVAEAVFRPGALVGEKVVLIGMSDCADRMIPGDVVVTASEKQHRIFRRKGKNLSCSIDITLRQSLCGFHAEVTQLDSRKIDVSSETVTPHGHKIVVSKEGIPKGEGQLEITVNVVFPSKIPRIIAAKLNECLDAIDSIDE